MAPGTPAAFCGARPGGTAPVVPGANLGVGRAGRSAAFAFAAALLAAGQVQAQSNNVRITKLSDVAFGSLANLGVDATSAQSICVFAHTGSNGYRVTATGSAPGGVFALSSGANLLAYDVQWSASAGQTSGTQLSPNATLTGLTSAATQQTCNNGPATSASLIVVLRSVELTSATAGSYTGTLTLLIGPE